MMYWVFTIVLLLSCFDLYADPGYILCIEGGGSKTMLQVIDSQGQIVSLIKDGARRDRVEGSGSNINVAGIDGVREVFNSLFDDVLVAGGQTLQSHLAECRVVAGMAGGDLPQNQQAIASLFEEKGIRGDHITVMSDAQMVLQLIQGEGIILIAGTGSVCFARKGDKLFRVGGLGTILGDEGSGYQIGLQAVRAGLAEEYGWGTKTRLTAALREHFQVQDLKTLIPKINHGDIRPGKIASSVPLVFTYAHERDEVAERIIIQSAEQLGDLVATMVTVSQLSGCEVHLWGGIFKNTHADAFIQKVATRARAPNLTWINKSHDNAALLFALQTYVSSDH